MSTDWEALFKEKEEEAEELREELEEFQATSKEMEDMFTADLDKAEDDLKAARRENERLAGEKQKMQAKLNEEKRELSDELESVKSQLAKESKALADLKLKHRQIEQRNDDLERKEREGVSQVETTEANLEQVIEEKVLLEADLEDAVAESQEKEQRLRDEIRDLSSELTVTKAKLTPRPGMVPPLALGALGTPSTPMAYTPGSAKGSAAASPLSTRGLVVIGDMLQRVKDMEERLSGCRSSLGQMLSERKTPSKGGTALASSSPNTNP